MTRRQLDDKAIYSLEGGNEKTLRESTWFAIRAYKLVFLSRGFYVDQIGEDGITTNVSGRSGYTAKNRCFTEHRPCCL